MSTEIKLAWAMIVEGKDSEAAALNNCLEDFTKYIDGLFITITHKPGEQRNKLVEAVAEKYGAIISDFEWINDFAAARNFNFSQVPTDYTHIGWCDSDDGIKGAYKLKTTIESRPDVDAFSMFYLYAFDEHKNATVVHQKTRVIKNDGCCTWRGLGLHEELSPNRELVQFAISGIDVIHMSNETRLADSRIRNFAIASTWITKSPNDPTAYFNLANSALGVGKYDIALENYSKFMSMSQSDDEKYIARLRKVDVLRVQNKITEALDEARYAIGLKSEYPDAYHAAGKIFYHLGQYEKAKDMFLNGLGRPAPYYQIIVYNPRDYDYQPLMDLAKTYYALNLPQLALPALEAACKIVPADEALKKVIETLKQESKEGDEIVEICSKLKDITDKKELKKELDKIPTKFKFHPMVLMIKNKNFIKETSTGKDLVIFCGYTAEEWTPETIAKKGSGGSEEALITMAQGLADKGWNVTVYNNCGTESALFIGNKNITAEFKDKEYDADAVYKIARQPHVNYKPYMSWNYRDKQDVTILWRQTKPLDWEINSTKVYVDMHDVIPTGEFTTSRVSRIDKVFFKSNYHKSLYNLPEDKTVVIPNGVNPAQFSDNVQRDNNLLINTSSPVRALSALIEIMKEVRLEVPEAKMQWAYGWETTDLGLQGNPNYAEWKTNILKGMKENGIEDIGRLNHKDVAKLYQKASMFIYPTGFPEIDCISITKALLAGTLPITTDYGAIKEKSGHGGEFIRFTDSEQQPGQIDYAVQDESIRKLFAKKIIKHLKTPPTDDYRKIMTDFAKTYDWTQIIEKWNLILCKPNS